ERLTERNPNASYRGSKVSTKLKVMGVELAVMGIKDAAHENDEVVNYVEPLRGIYKKLIIRNGRLAGAILLGDASGAPGLLQAIKQQNLYSVSAVFEALGDGREDPASKAGLASLLKTIWGKDYEDERDARFINDRVHANIQKDKTFSVIPRIYGGVTSPSQL